MNRLFVFSLFMLPALPAAAGQFAGITPANIAGVRAAAPASQPAAVPGQEEDKKFKVCWIRTVEKDACVYKCSDGALLRQTPASNTDGSHAGCPQLVFPLNKSVEKSGNYSMLFFDEYGDGETQIPAALRRYGVEVTGAEQEGRMTFVSYRADRPLIKQAETRVYPPSASAALTAELDAILARLKAEGARVVWLSRWTELPQYAATVYYLDAR